MKRNVTVSLEDKKLELAKERNINLSGTLDQLLGNYLYGKQATIEEIKDEIAEHEAAINSLQVKLENVKKTNTKEEKRQSALDEKLEFEKQQRREYLQTKIRKIEGWLHSGKTVSGEDLTDDAKKRLERQLSLYLTEIKGLV